MKTKDLLFYLVLGAALGAVAGGAAAGALALYARHRWWAISLFALAGAIAAAAGGPASGSRRAAMRDAAAGFALAGAGFFLLTAARTFSGVPIGNALAVGLVFFTFIFSAAVGASHAWSLRERDALPAAALFGGVAGLLALAAGMKTLSPESLTLTGALSGAVYGGLVWLAIGVARRLFSVDVGQFRV
jgi:hypothetical protein